MPVLVRTLQLLSLKETGKMSKTRQKVALLPDIQVKLASQLFKVNIPEGIIVRENPKMITHYHTYGGLSDFYKELTHGKLMGTRCSTCDKTKIWLPPRVHCPDCWEKMRWVELGTNNVSVYTCSTTNLPGAGFKATFPCPLISVDIPEVWTKFMSYLSEFGEGEPYIGMPVRPVFNTEHPTYSILDISWVPVD